MQTRRCLLGALPGMFALAGYGSVAWASDDPMPPAALIPGNPALLDYGGGVKVPCNREAFYTLWESATFWLSFGFGIAPSIDISKIRAEKQASGVMKFMLLTLAFAPERLVKVDGNGWRKKDPKAHDFVIGDLPLPAQTNKSMSDAFLGGGNTKIDPLWDRVGSQSAMTGATPGIDQAPAGAGPLANMQQAMRYAFSSTIVQKKDMSLDDVRRHAVVLQL